MIPQSQGFRRSCDILNISSLHLHWTSGHQTCEGSVSGHQRCQGRKCEHTNLRIVVDNEDIKIVSWLDSTCRSEYL